MSWTDERVEELKRLWNEGHAATQIAARLGGTPRTAVIGKVHRLGLTGRAQPSKPRRTRIEKAASGTAKLRALSVTPRLSEPGDSLNVTVLGIEANQCRWPIGDPASPDFHFCGQPTRPGKPYCCYHQELATTKPLNHEQKKERAVQSLRRSA